MDGTEQNMYVSERILSDQSLGSDTFLPNRYGRKWGKAAKVMIFHSLPGPSSKVLTQAAGSTSCSHDQCGGFGDLRGKQKDLSICAYAISCSHSLYYHVTAELQRLA